MTSPIIDETRPIRTDGSEHDPRRKRAMDWRNATRLETHWRVMSREYEGEMSEELREILVRLLGEVHRLWGGR